MLLKLKINTVTHTSNVVKRMFSCNQVITRTLLCCYLTLVAGNLHAEEIQNAITETFHVHGFLSQGIIDVDGSDFVNDTGDISAELTELGLNASYKLNEQFRFAGQIVYLDGGNRYIEGARLDYLLVDWSAYTNENWQANIYLGRFKNNHWLYSSSRDIPFARPSIILPQSVYFDGFRDIAVGSDGLATKLSYSDDYFGNIDWQVSYGTSPLSDEQTKNLLSQYAMGSAEQEYDAQTSFYWQPAFSAWRYGISLLEASFSYEQGAPESGDVFYDSEFFFQLYTLNALYEGERWEFSGEIYQQRFVVDGFYFPGYTNDNFGRGFYLQTRYKVNNQLTLLARYEDFYADKDDKDGKALEENSGGQVPYYFGFHKDTTIGLNYDITSNFSVRAEYHWVKGAAKLTPVVLPNPEINSTEDWSMWAVQLMYWF